MSKKIQDIEEYLSEAITNIREDRKTASYLLTELMMYLQKDPERHRNSGLVASKYLETLQRSNEQLVKITALLKKGTEKDTFLSDDEKNDIFEQFQEEDNLENKK